MEQNIEATLNQAAIEFTDAENSDLADAGSDEDEPHPVNVARGDHQEHNAEDARADGGTSERNTRQIQEAERADGDAADQPHPESDNDSQQSH